ncbi:MAG TPA: 50S ribosomal protein L9 [Anaerolineales bacterium]
MRVLLLKDVYKLGRAGDVKRVADGYGRNYLIPQGMATLATPGALKQADRIRSSAEVKRAQLNQEMTAVFTQLDGLQLNFPVKAGETGRLYGSVTHQMLTEAVQQRKGITVERSQILGEPIRSLGVHKVKVRLTVDLIPELAVVVHREELSPESAFEQVEAEPEQPEAAGSFSDLQAELEAQEAEAARKSAERDRETSRGPRREPQAQRTEGSDGREEEGEGTGAE